MLQPATPGMFWYNFKVVLIRQPLTSVSVSTHKGGGVQRFNKHPPCVTPPRMQFSSPKRLLC